MYLSIFRADLRKEADVRWASVSAQPGHAQEVRAERREDLPRVRSFQFFLSLLILLAITDTSVIKGIMKTSKRRVL